MAPLSTVEQPKMSSISSPPCKEHNVKYPIYAVKKTKVTYIHGHYPTMMEQTSTR